MTSRKKLPSKDELLETTENDMKKQWARGIKTNKAHAMGSGYQDAYFADLATTAGTEAAKPVIFKIYDKTRYIQKHNLDNYRNFRFTILDDENFVAKFEA